MIFKKHLAILLTEKSSTLKKHILITGSTDGIGKLAAIKLIEQGHMVYLHGRNAQKLTHLVEEIKQKVGTATIKGFVADFSDLEAVKGMAEDIMNEGIAIDVLINNAGVFKSTVLTNQKGMDLRYVVNYLAPYVLTHSLLPLLKKGTHPRVINLSSAAQAPISIDILTGKTSGSMQETYAQSKLALTMWSFYLAKQLPEISVIAVNPGSLLNTNMVREAYGRYWSSAEKGANILYELAVSDKYQGITGQYFDNDTGGFGPAHPDANKEMAIEQLIAATEDLVK